MAASEDKKSNSEASSSDSIKETLESIIIALILAFVFRAYVVEAFIIPTGSMAPTLLGAHVDLRSEQSGYQYPSDPSRVGPLLYRANQNRDQPVLEATDPMTLLSIDMDRGIRTRPGDRILVHKYIYYFSEPRRWDVVVFKAPHEPQTNYIKRLVGLPNESLVILDGNIYTQRGSEPWEIARKTDPSANPKWRDIQNDVWQPIYHSRFVPIKPDEIPAKNGDSWKIPWVPDQPDQWTLNGREGYRYTGSEPTTLSFDFAAGPYNSNLAMYSYNQLKENTINPYENRLRSIRRNPLVLGPQPHPIEDIRLSVIVKPETDNAMGVTLQTTGRWDELSPDAKPLQIRAVVNLTGEVRLETQAPDSTKTHVLDQAKIDPIKGDKPRRLELWYVDQHLMLFDGKKKVLEAETNLSMDRLMERAAPAILPEVEVQLTGGPASLLNVELDRDLYYIEFEPGSAATARGGLKRNPTGQIVNNSPVLLEADQFFCMGDNGPSSHDSRSWDNVNRWVHHQSFHKDSPLRPGIVPRELMIGRAFFVYFPAPLAISNNTPAVVPDFGKMRFIH